MQSQIYFKFKDRLIALYCWSIGEEASGPFKFMTEREAKSWKVECGEVAKELGEIAGKFYKKQTVMVLSRVFIGMFGLANKNCVGFHLIHTMLIDPVSQHDVKEHDFSTAWLCCPQRKFCLRASFSLVIGKQSYMSSHPFKEIFPFFEIFPRTLPHTSPYVLGWLGHLLISTWAREMEILLDQSWWYWK